MLKTSIQFITAKKNFNTNYDNIRHMLFTLDDVLVDDKSNE